MRAYIASKYISHKKINEEISCALRKNGIDTFLPQSINVDAVLPEQMVLSLKITSCKNIINYRIGCYAKYIRMVTNSPRNKNFQWFGAGNGFCKRKNSRKANIGLRFSGEKIRASVVLSY